MRGKTMDVPPDIEKVLPGVAGSLTALAFFRAPWPRLLSLMAGGSAFAYYVGPSLTPWIGERLSGYYSGVFGMVVVAKVFEAVVAFDSKRALRDLWKAVLSRVRGGR